MRYLRPIPAAAAVTAFMLASPMVPAGQAEAPDPAAEAQDTIFLGRSFPIGQVEKYHVRARHSAVETTADETINRWLLRRGVKASFEIREGSEEGATVALTFDTILLEVHSPSREEEFNSELPDWKRQVGPAVAACEPILEAEFLLTVSPDGEITGVSGNEPFLREPDLLAYASAIASDEAIKEMFGPVFRAPSAPAGEARYNDSWNNPSRPMNTRVGRVTFDEKWTVGHDIAGKARVRLRGEASFESDGSRENAQLSNAAAMGSFSWFQDGSGLDRMEISRFAAVKFTEDPRGPGVSEESVLTISRIAD